MIAGRAHVGDAYCEVGVGANGADLEVNRAPSLEAKRGA